MSQVGDLMSCGSKAILENAPCLSHVLILTTAPQIWWFIRWLKIPKNEYLKNGT